MLISMYTMNEGAGKFPRIMECYVLCVIIGNNVSIMPLYVTLFNENIEYIAFTLIIIIEFKIYNFG